MHLIWPPFWIEYFPPFSVAGDPSEKKKRRRRVIILRKVAKLKTIDTVAFVKIKVSPGELGTLFIIKIQYFFCINDKNGFYKHLFVSIHLSDEGQV